MVKRGGMLQKHGSRGHRQVPYLQVIANQTDVTVVGAGAAGLYTALCAARHGAQVTLISAGPLAGASSYWAQGGLSAALADDDTPDRHFADTIAAGRGSVRESAARVLCDEAPAAVQDLTRLGVTFDADRTGRLALGLEGGHSARRIVHAGGAATGRRIIRQLSALAAEDERITVLEGHRAVRILTAQGRALGVALDNDTVIAARAVVVATGGAAALWARTTNPPGAIGAGLLLTYAAGAQLADLELMQFHPTVVRGANGADGFMVTEAIRGEGARLLDSAGERFVNELAPRDEVARAVQRQIDSSGGTPVRLDMRDVDPALFPNVVSALRKGGIDPERELIPVAPAAHYMMGGIATDLYGRASLAGLYAVGECSCTGLHGANRLASNSLSECFVFGARAARAALDEPASSASPTAPLMEPPRFSISPESRAALWRHAGLERDGHGLLALTRDEHPLVRLIAAGALARQESRGAHQRLDFPQRSALLDGRHVTITAGSDPTLETWS